MTTQEITNRINFYTNTFLDTVRRAVKENIDGLEAGRLALELVGCPKNVALEIERLMFVELNK